MERIFGSIGNRVVFLLLIAFAAGSLWQSFVLNNASLSDWGSGFWQNFSTEMMGAIITFALFELLLGTRQRAADQVETRQREQQLRAFFDRLNKQSAERDRNSRVENAKARLRLATTPTERQPILDEMHALDLLRGTDLVDTDLSGARLRYKNLSGAILSGAVLDDALWNEHTVLPDGTYWTPAADVMRFTETDHPQHEETLATINSIRLGTGQRLIWMMDENSNRIFPLSNERLQEAVMWERVNQRREELGLEPLS